MKKKTVIITLAIVIPALLVLSPCILGVLWVGMGSHSNKNPEQGENEPSVDWLPDEASNVSYYKTYSWTAYEFKISEEGFKKWASRVEFRRIKEPVSMSRYCSRNLEPLPIEFTDEEYAAHEAKKSVMIENGYYYSSPPRSNGGFIRYAYDLDTGTAYYHDMPR